VADEEKNDETEAPAEPAEEEASAEATTVEEVEAAAGEVEADSEPAAAAEATPAKKTRSGRHVPRSDRRQRPKPKREAVPGAARKPITRQPKPEGERGRSQMRRGVVVSAAMDKTIVVRVESIKSHPKYKKVIRRSKKFHAHDEQNEAKVGDVVQIVETRPLSATKRWRLNQVLEVAR
jgi:small subunit ribosomal protein S17